MTAWSWIFLAACAVLVTVPMYFIVHRVYQDGIVGRIALSLIAFAAATFFLDMIDGTEWEILPQIALMTAAFAAFLVWHLWRFHRRVLKTYPDFEVERRKTPDRRFIHL